MQFRDFENHFKGHQLITTQSIRNAFGKVERSQLSRWEGNGWLARIRQGQYLLSLNLGKVDKELLANEIKNSYISLGYALNLYNLIPQIPQKITSVTTERSEEVETPLGGFIYQRVKPKLFCGYELRTSRIEGRKTKIATPTKALFDWVYLGGGSDRLDFEEARFNLDELREVFKISMFKNWMKFVTNPATKSRLKNFLGFLEKQC